MRTRKIIAATVALLWSGTCSFALDVGVGGVGVSAGSDGVSAGVGGASVGVGVGSDGSVGAEASVGGTSAGVGTGAASSSGSGGSSGTSGGADSSGGSSSSSSNASSASSGSQSASDDAGGAASAPASRSATVAPGGGGQISLPDELRPVGWAGIFWRLESSAPIPTIAGTSRKTIDACREAVAQAAQPYGMVDVTAVSYGQTVQRTDGGYVAPVFMRVVYERQGGHEMRQAPILCEIDQAGAVSGLSEATG